MLLFLAVFTRIAEKIWLGRIENRTLPLVNHLGLNFFHGDRTLQSLSLKMVRRHAGSNDRADDVGGVRSTVRFVDNG